MSTTRSRSFLIPSPRTVPYAIAICQRKFAVPNNQWTPVPLGHVEADSDGMHVVNAATAVVDVSSNGVTLPAATIHANVPTSLAASGFDAAGEIIITGPPGTATDTVISYTGISGKDFTGCTLGTGTLATGQAIAPANDIITAQSLAGMYVAFAQVSFAAAGNTTGVLGVRVSSTLFGTYVPVSESIVGNVNFANHNIAAGGLFVLTSARAEVFQTSGAPLAAVVDGIQATGLSVVFATPQ